MSEQLVVTVQVEHIIPASCWFLHALPAKPHGPTWRPGDAQAAGGQGEGGAQWAYLEKTNEGPDALFATVFYPTYQAGHC